MWFMCRKINLLKNVEHLGFLFKWTYFLLIWTGVLITFYAEDFHLELLMLEHNRLWSLSYESFLKFIIWIISKAHNVKRFYNSLYESSLKFIVWIVSKADYMNCVWSSSYESSLKFIIWIVSEAHYMNCF